MADVMVCGLAATARAALSAPRWVYGDVSHYALTNGCPCCGTMYGDGARHIPCRPVECMLCGSVQCHSNGLGNGHCKVCHHGFLPGWSGTSGNRCGYAGCDEPAVGTVRKKLACKSHALARVGADVNAAIAVRDGGKGWQRWTFTGPRIPW